MTVIRIGPDRRHRRVCTVKLTARLSSVLTFNRVHSNRAGASRTRFIRNHRGALHIFTQTLSPRVSINNISQRAVSDSNIHPSRRRFSLVHNRRHRRLSRISTRPRLSASHVIHTFPTLPSTTPYHQDQPVHQLLETRLWDSWLKPHTQSTS